MALRIPQTSAALTDSHGRATEALNGLFQQLKQALLVTGTLTVGDVLIVVDQNHIITGGQGPGITRLTGDVIAGPGSGSQVATLQTFAHTFLLMGG